jgi:predicted nucleic acid-binding protein
LRFIDTNIFLRYITGDDPAKASACLALFEKVDSGEEEIATSEAVIAEVAYVLRSRNQYGLNREEVSARLKPLISLRGLRIARKGLYLRALDMYAGNPTLDFEDALTVVYMEDDGITELFSYDQDFDRIPQVKRLEP